MAYGKLKVDTLTWDNSGSDTDVTISSLGAKADLNSPTFTGTVTAAALTVSGNLQVNGTTTTVASSTMTVADKNIEIAQGAANDAAADGGGITLKSGDGDKTITWANNSDCWTFNQGIKTTQGNVYIYGTEGGPARLYLNADEADDNADYWRISHEASDNCVYFANYTTGSYNTVLKLNPNGALEDSKGDVRKIPQQNEQGSAHTLVAADSGKHILADATVTVPPTSGIFSAGDAITIINTSGSDISIARGSGVTMYNAADGTNANRTLGTKGMATILCAGSNTYYISGAGLS